MSKNKCIEVEKNAPNFLLKDQNNKEFKLSDFRGKKVLLSFHPLAWSSICSDQMKSLEKNWEKFEDLNTIPLGISIDTTISKKAWTDSLGIKNTRLLSDFWPHGQVAEMYGIFREKEGFSERANIIINEKQKISFVCLYEISELPDINEIINILISEE